MPSSRESTTTFVQDAPLFVDRIAWYWTWPSGAEPGPVYEMLACENTTVPFGRTSPSKAK